MKTNFLKTLLCCMIAVSMSNFASAQDNLPLVTVTGKGEVKVTPDEVAIRFEIDKSDRKISEAKAQVDAVLKRVRENTTQFSITTDQMKLDYLQIYPNYDEDEVNYYRVSQGVTIVLKNIEEYENFVTVLLQNGVNSIRNVEFKSSELRKYKDQARELAVIAAREKATALARTLGQSIGQAYSIEEGSDNGVIWPVSNRYSNIAAESGQAEEAVVSGKITVTANVTVKFYLK